MTGDVEAEYVRNRRGSRLSGRRTGGRKKRTAQDDCGAAVRYSLDADYELVNNIPLESDVLWTLPEGFTGSFSRTPQEDANCRRRNGYLYIYNNYCSWLPGEENSNV